MKCFLYLCRHIPIAAILYLVVTGSHAADPQPYGINLDKTHNTQLDQQLQEASNMISLQKIAPVGPFALIARAKEDQERFIQVLHSLGYYKSTVILRIAGHPLDDPDLLSWLIAAPANKPVPVYVGFTLGSRFHLRTIKIAGNAPQEAQDWLKLRAGGGALAGDVLAARERLLNALREQGYAQAKVAEPIATLREEIDAIDVLFQVESGAKAVLGEIKVNGLKKLNAAFVKKRLTIATGQRFKPTAIETAQQDLMGLGVFSSVRTQVDKQLDEQGREPVVIDVIERPQHAVNMGAAYSTDLGGNFSGAWLHRNLFGNAEQLKLTAALTQLGGNSTTGIGYKVGAAFIKPDFLTRDQSLLLGVDALKQSLIAYDETAVMFHMTLNRKLATHWHGSFGIAAQQMQISQENVTRDYTLLSLPLTLKYDSSNSLLDPTQGVIATASVTPTQSFANTGNKPFVLAQVSASSYWDLGEAGRSVLALRGMVGVSGGVSQFGLPPDQRFYAGGSSSVRGYKYQSVGPAFADNTPQGGTAMAAGSVELRHRILDNYGVVLFADAGQVSVDAFPFSNLWQIGAGIGVRYYTSFGPIRVDVALPVNPQPNSGSFEVYVGLGQAF
jgi:translocation and assembly module TamA